MEIYPRQLEAVSTTCERTQLWSRFTTRIWSFYLSKIQILSDILLKVHSLCCFELILRILTSAIVAFAFSPVQTNVHWSLPLQFGCIVIEYKTSQELRMLSSVTINCQITKIVMNSGSQLLEL